MADRTPSKSQRVREYFESNPTASNKDALAALEQYGVKYGDVTNVKNQMKKKGVKLGSKTRAGRKASKQAPATTRAQAVRSPAARSTAPTGAGMPAIQAGVNFVNEAGGIEQADQILSLIRTIRQGS